MGTTILVVQYELIAKDFDKESTVDVAAFASALVLASVFAIAATAKLLSGGAHIAHLRIFGVPSGLVTRLRWVLPIMEMSVAVLLVSLPTAQIGGVFAALLLVLFTFVLAVSIARRVDLPCFCFGAQSEGPAGWRPIIRNVFLLGVTAVIILHPPRYESWTQQAFAATLVVAVVQAWLLWAPGGRRVHSSVRPLASSASPLHSASAAPSRSDAGPVQLRSAASPVQAADSTVNILVFVDPHCGPCQRLLPHIAEHQRRMGSDGLRVVTRGGSAAAADLEREFGLIGVVGHDDATLEIHYGVTGTPSAVLESASSTSATVVAGFDAVLELLSAMPAASVPSPAWDAPVPAPTDSGRTMSEPPPTAMPASVVVRAGTPRLAGAWSPMRELASLSSFDILGQDGQGAAVPAGDPGGRWTVVLRSGADADSRDVVATAIQLLAPSRYRLVILDGNGSEFGLPASSLAQRVTVTESMAERVGLVAVPSVLLLDRDGRTVTAPAVGLAPTLATVTALTHLRPEDLEEVSHAAAIG